MIVEIPMVVHIRWNQLQPQLASRNSLLMILTKISTGLSQSSNSSQIGASIRAGPEHVPGGRRLRAKNVKGPVKKFKCYIYPHIYIYINNTQTHHRL
ncbi:hypothetical protein Hanom_Chr04g00299341 [Helianthus anomalus]